MVRRMALIVGGSRGMGLAMANEFATHGFDLFLVARSEPELRAVADRLMADGETRVEILALDATDRTAPARIAAALDASRATLRYAVIAVGYWDAGASTQLAPETLERIVGVNVVAPHALQKAIVSKLAPGGGLLFVGSLAGCRPLPWVAAYAASKAHLHAAVMALRQEMHGTGIKICLLAPGAVRTAFIPRQAGGQWRWLFDLFASRPETVAFAAYRGLASDVPVIVPGLVWRLFWLGMRVLPDTLLDPVSRLALQTLRSGGPAAPVATSKHPARQ